MDNLNMVGRMRSNRVFERYVTQAFVDVVRWFVELVYNTVNRDYNQAAAILGIHPRGLHRLLDTLGLSHLKG